MTNTDILLEDLEDVLDDATSMPMTKKCLVDVEKIKTIIEDIRLNTPHETKQAKAIIDSRNTILDDAQKDAQAIIAEAEAQARELVARDQITQTAQAQAAEILAKAREEGETVSVKHRLVQVKSSELQLLRLMKCLLLHRRIKRILLMQLITMQRIRFLLLMMHFIKRFRMSEAFARI